ncbi:MAG: hypothetical protein HQ562_03210 [Candidatus Marinimicrobia bacterium]|nr:hypothetical protein [Candidatus Neomarinimicrobiota bacterium]
MPAFYSDFKKIMILVILFSVSNLMADGLFHYDARLHSPLTNQLVRINAGLSSALAALETDSAAVTEEIVFPARPMLMSLIVPGLGQVYNKSPWWKTAIFAGVEVAGIVGWWSFTNKAEDKRLEYEEFADLHWDLERWYSNSQLIFGDDWESVIRGTHHLTLIINDQYWSSDTIVYLQSVYNFNEIDWAHDRDYYENIGKYNQFVGGWDDPFDDPDDSEGNWYTVEKDVGDSTENIIMTVNKDKYLDMRLENNDLLKIAGYAVTAVMFNHVISAIEAVYSSQSQARKRNTDTSVGLIYDRNARYGVGGLAFSMRF